MSMATRYQMFAWFRFSWYVREGRIRKLREKSFYGVIDFMPGAFGMTYSDLFKEAEQHFRQAASLPANASVIDWKIQPNRLDYGDWTVPSVDNNEWTF